MKNHKNNIFWGIIFLLAAIFLIVGKLGYLGGISLFSILLTIMLIAILLKSIPSVNFAGILFPLAILCILYDKQLHIEALTPWTVLGVALLGSIGLQILFRRDRLIIRKLPDNVKYSVIDEPDSSHIRHATSFTASTKYINTEDFKQADFSCSFGALSVYFENAKVPDGSAIVNLQANFSGVELYIPKEWTVESQMSISLGAVEEKNHPHPDGSVTLHLVGSASFCGVEITYI